jgi:DNA invertase Pin-like site-specific DNA recombinase
MSKDKKKGEKKTRLSKKKKTKKDEADEDYRQAVKTILDIPGVRAFYC